MSARADPPLPLHVLRVRGALTEVRARHLAFTQPEAAELLAAHGLALDRSLVDALHARTEGWAAGLRLAALSLIGRDDPASFVAEFAGDDRVVADYLVAEVLDRQPARLRAFLLRTSVVDRLCGGLAEAITGESGGADALASLERTNGFVIGLDAHRTWYRYHSLLAQLLRVRLAREAGAEVGELHRRAARWLSREGESWEALQHAVAGEDWELATELVADNWFGLFVRGQGSPLLALLDRVPPERVRADGELSAIAACTCFDGGDPEGGRARLAEAERDGAAIAPGRRGRYLEAVALARLYAARAGDDLEGAVEAADDVLSQAAHETWSDEARQAVVHAILGATAMWTGQQERAAHDLQRAVDVARAAGLDYVALGALGHLALLELATRGPASAGPVAREATELAGRRGWTGVTQATAAHVAAAAVALFESRLDDADEHVARAYDAAADTRDLHRVVVRTHVAARIHAARGRPEAGLREIQAVETLYAQRLGRHLRGWLDAMRARLLVTTGELDRAAVALGRARAAWPESAELEAVGAGLRLAQGDAEGALGLLTASHAAPLLSVTSVELAMLEAVALDALHQPGRSAEALERALGAADATGHRRTLIDGGRHMQALLRRQVSHGTAHRGVVSELLDALEDRAPAQRAVAPLLEPLSEREQAVLRYLPTPLSNREIAAELFVTTNTVKTHLRSIYRKLDVARRREAVERARDLRLLSTRSRL
jgi:LuxR family maltose regulon positive regulatory protein